MSRRGFTMLELVLASTLGLLVLGTALSIFGALRAGFDRSVERSHASVELSRLHVALRECLRQVAVLPRQRGRNAQTSTTVAVPVETPAAGVGGDESGVPAGKGGNPARPPRLLVDRDGAGLPRLELVTTRAPLSVPRSVNTARANAEVGGGVRGAFELRPGADGVGFDVWWRAYELETAPDGARLPLAEAKIASGFTRLSWTVYKSDEQRTLKKQTSISAVESKDLPAYLELEAETVLGYRSKWMFEIGWLLARDADGGVELPPELAERFAKTDPETGETVPEGSVVKNGDGKTGAGAGPGGGKGSPTPPTRVPVVPPGRKGQMFGPDGRPLGSTP